MNLVSKRYAYALLEIAHEKKLINSYCEQLKECVNIIDCNSLLCEILSNPENRFSLKKDLLQSLFSNSVDNDVINLFYILVDKQRLDIIGDILLEYQNGMQEYEKVINVTAVSAFPISNIDVDKIKIVVRDKFNILEVNISNIIDESLIGGFRLIIGNEIIDRSVLGMVNKMKNHIVSR